jgi:hypothetical protein
MPPAALAETRATPAMDAAAVAAASARHPKPVGYTPSYGTAGFRDAASLLDSTVFRCGLLIAARALATGAACGVMITASHNVDSDNGVKLVEPSGEMLEPAWEALATALAQAADDNAVSAALGAVLAAHPPAAAPANPKVGPRVIVGRDTRESGPRLAAAAAAGAAALGVPVTDIGVVTTPELHSAVMAFNAYAALGEEPYFTSLTESFRTLVDGTRPPGTPLYVDCANGVGGLKLAEMAAPLAALGLRMEMVNTGGGRLNHLCGADYVQKEQTFPEGERALVRWFEGCVVPGICAWCRGITAPRAPTQRQSPCAPPSRCARTSSLKKLSCHFAPKLQRAQPPSPIASAPIATRSPRPEGRAGGRPLLQHRRRCRPRRVLHQAVCAR